MNNVDRAPATAAPSSRDSVLPAIDLGAVLRDSVEKVLRHWLLLAVMVTGAVAVGLAYVLTATPVYTANGSILIDPRVGQTPESNAGAMPGLLMSDALTVDSELRVLTSREVTQSAARDLGLFEAAQPSEPSFARRMLGALPDFGLGDEPEQELAPETREERRTEAVRRAFTRGLRVERAGETFVIDVTYTSPGIEFSARAVNTLIEQYLSVSGRRQIASAERTQTWLAERVEELGAGVEAAEQAVAEYRTDNALLAPEGQLLPSEIALNAANEELVRLQGEALALEVQLRQLGSQIESGNIEAVQLPPEERSAALDEFETTYSQLLQEEKELLLTWDSEAPVMQSLARRKAQTRELILDEYGQIRDRLAARAETLRQRVTATRELLGELQAAYGEDARKTVQLRRLEREAEAKRQLYERLLEEYNSTSQLLTFDSTSARVIAWAVPPDSKSAPQSKRVVVLAAFGGLVVALGLIFLIEAVDNRFRRQADVPAVLGLNFLGIVPSFRSDRRRARAAAIDPGAGERLRGWRRLPAALRTFGFAASWPTSVTAETMRGLQVQLALARPRAAAGQGGTVIGITSSVRDEGKTTTAFNFANFLAARGESVAIVDLDTITCDLTRTLRRVLPEANMLPRFCENPEAAMPDLVPIEEFPGLAVIGNVPHQGTSAFGPRDAERVGRALAVLREHFDHVIVDLPPLHGVAETRLLVTLCDTLVLAVRWGATPKEQVASALRQHGLRRDRFFGALFTRVPLRRYEGYNRTEVNEYYA